MGILDKLRLSAEGHVPSLGGATEWLNSEPLTADDLRGHVVAFDFWTFTCINWIRTALANNYWPALYVADAEGAIRFHRYGEEGYEESERAIQQLLGLSEESGLADVEPKGTEVPADWGTLQSPETYLGAE